MPLPFLAISGDNSHPKLAAFVERREPDRVRLFYVYILANRKHGTPYVGVTNDVGRRTWEHRTGVVVGFTSRHSVYRPVYYAVHESVLS